MIPRLDGGQGIHRLLVDDSRAVRNAARRLLEGFGFAVREAEDGQQALDAGAQDYVMKPFGGELRGGKLQQPGLLREAA